MALFSIKHLKSLVPGDQMTTPGILAGMDPDTSLIWELLEPEPNTKSHIFRVEYLGVSLGDVKVTPGNKAKLEWL